MWSLENTVQYSADNYTVLSFVIYTVPYNFFGIIKQVMAYSE
jgi:hypothetical protein